MQVVPSKLARDERENVKLSLTENGNAFSWIQICPRFKIDKEGDRILSNSEVYLKVAERTNEYIHRADRDPPIGKYKEINCSLEQTSWKLNIYQSGTDTFDKNILLASQLVYVNDPETKSYLSFAKPIVVEQENEGDENDVNDADVHPNYDIVQEQHIKGDEDIKTAVLIPASQDQIDSSFLWLIESSSFEAGGPIKWKTDLVRFKHFNSGMYLQLETFVDMTDDGRAIKTYKFVGTIDKESMGTLFSITEINSNSKYLGNMKANQIGHNGVWIERGDVIHDSIFNFTITGGKDKENALSLVIMRYSGSQKSSKEDSEEDSMIDPSVRMKEPLDIFVGLSAFKYIEKYFLMTEVPQDATVNTIWPTAGRTDIETFKSIVDKIVIFTQGFHVATEHIVEGIDKADPGIRRSRQNLLRGQGILDLLINFINKLIPVFEKSTGKTSLDTSIMIRMAHTVQSLCFSVLYQAINDNPDNQMFVADHMPVLLANLNTQPLAVKCVTEMLSKNMELQETKIGTREIRIFVDKLKASRFNTMYLNLLQACCSCQGDGVDGNQCKVASMLFDEGCSDVIVEITVDKQQTIPVSWNNGDGLYILSSTADDSNVRASDLINSGLPKLYVSWMSSDDAVVKFPLEDLFPVSSGVPEEMASSIKKLGDSKERLSVANYLLAEMFLGAEMCLDRNYVAMHKLDKLFPYDLLVTILKMDVNSSLKAAAIRLLMCLHVDRDPQASSKIPCLTRAWTDVKKNEEPQLPFVEPNRRYTFGLIQQMISDQIREMAGNRWNDYCQHMLKMLRAMVEFNFYGSNERIQDIIQPIVAALDRRNVVFADAISKLPGSVSSKTPSLANIGPQKSGLFSAEDLTNEAENDDKGNEKELEQEEDEEEEEEDLRQGNNEDETGTFDELSSMSTYPRLRKSEKFGKRSRYRKLLQRLNSKLFNFVVIFFTVLSLGNNLYKILFTPVELEAIQWFVEVGFLGIFSLEMSLKIYFSSHFKKGILKFFANPINSIDVLAISANIAIFFLTTLYIAILVKGLRLLRIFRMFNLVKVAKVSLEIKDVQNADQTHESTLMRYSKVPISELETMVEAIRILATIQKIIEDRNLSLFLRNFYLWEGGLDKRDPAQLFVQTVQSSNELTLNVEEFESVMLDCLMFSYSPLVQGVLEILQSYYSMRNNILENAKNVQLIVSSRREKQYRMVDQMLQQLEQNAETHELWGELETDEDYRINKQTKEILQELINLCRVRRQVLEFDEDFMADTEIQDLYRNLGCFEICMKVMGLLDSVEEDEDGNLDDVALNTRNLCLLCNTLLFWFFLGNEKNQELGYEELELFLNTLDDEINSHLVIRAIFKNNEALMRQVPHTHLADMVDRIIKNGKSHHYLSLFATISHVGERNIVENQFEIVKSLTSPGRLQKVSCFFVPIDHPEYEQKRLLMAPFLESDADLSLEDMPPLLAYHLTFLEVLSGCTVGRMNITTVEAKVQSVFNYVDMLQSILDPGTILVCKIRLSMFFYNSIIEVELKIAGLEQSSYIWRLLESYVQVLGYAKDQIRTVEKLGWEAPEVSRQKIEYIIVCILITGGFFSRYFDYGSFRYHEGPLNPAAATDKVQISQAQVNNLITSLFHKIKDVYDLDSPRLSADTKESIFMALEALNKSTSKVIMSDLSRNNVVQNNASKEINTAEGKLLQKYRKFVEELADSSEVQSQIHEENVAFISILEKLPSISDPVDADIRYETLITKLVTHIRSSVTTSETRKYMSPQTTRTSTWIIRAFRTMIENRMGMSIYERDDDGGLEQDIAAAPVVNALNTCGATTLCLDLIADGIDAKLQLEAVKLGVALLFKEGGALEVQTTMNSHLSKGNSECFFKQVRLTLQKLQAWHSWNQIIILEEGQEPNPPEEILIVRFLQLMCEGHFLPNQDIMREQPNNHTAFNLLEDFVNYLNCLSRLPCRTSTNVAIRLSATILEVIQGPCEGNQTYFTLSTELIETLNRLNRAKLTNDCAEEEEIELKKQSIDIFQGLLEGQGEKSVVYERVLSVIHLDIIHMMSKGMGIVSDVPDDSSKTEESEEKVILQTECVVLLQMLCNFKPSLYEELGISKNVEDIVGSGTAMIEVVWRGDIHRRFFHVPKVCKFLAKSSKDALVENVDRSNPENKLIDFLNRSHDLYREVKHQQYLTEMGLSRIFSRENQNSAFWITFLLSLIMNSLFLAYYRTPDGVPVIVDPNAQTAVNAINAMQSCAAGFLCLLQLVVRSPVLYQAYAEAGHSTFYTILYTAADGQTVYSFLYLLLSVLGLVVANYYLPFLLLDNVAKNATTRDILNAVVLPRKQLAMTVVLAVFVNYIFAYFIVSYFSSLLTCVNIVFSVSVLELERQHWRNLRSWSIPR